MSSLNSCLRSRWRRTVSRITLLLCCLPLLPCQIVGLNSDGVLLLSFKYSTLSDPLSVLGDWNYADSTPCSWNGVMCMGFPSTNSTTFTWNSSSSSSSTDISIPATSTSRVIGLVLPDAQLLGSIPSDLGLIEHLRHLDLSGNFLNGTLPATLFNASDLRILSLSNNEISGELPEIVGEMKSLQSLNLSGNALVGRVPTNLTLLPNLTTVSLANNYLSGELPGGGFQQLEILDLSSNLLNGSLPLDLGVKSLRYLNLSSNRLAGGIPPELAARIPANALIDLSFNNLTGEIPQSGAFLAQKPMAFAGNSDLCGKPLKNMCTIPSSLSNSPPNDSTATPPRPKSPPALAAIPEIPDRNSSPASAAGGGGQRGLKPAAVVAIAVGDITGIVLLVIVFLYVFQVKNKNRELQQQHHHQKNKGDRGIGLERMERGGRNERPPSASPESRGLGALSWCLRKKGGDSDDTEEASETSASSETGGGEEEQHKRGKQDGKTQAQQNQQRDDTLVTVDGPELDLETLLKASAYILGATGSSIVYKAVLADGTALAVRRMGESSSIDKFKDFDAQVRSIAKFRHPNLLRIRGFYWGAEEKLLIHDYAPNGSLANISFSKKLGSSPLRLNWNARLRIARGVARGLAYLHEKKCVHGNVKPSNILLGADMEPVIGDFGLERLMPGDGSYGPGASARQFGSKRSVLSTSSLPDLSAAAGASPCGCSSTSAFAPPPYQSPESLKNLKPNVKWDVYSFGMVLLELIAGRVFPEVELCQWNAGFVVEERNKIRRMADPALRGEVGGKEEALLTCFKLGFACCSSAPQRRPSMKDAVLMLEKVAATSSSSWSSQ
ncbi:probable LRR receptor-like serine/threonine-protein kinase At4g37250 [Elaeis guineensis]|uniref:Probable LRR receptor-like serine/threonine-protein kinase At4g37250 n=1 Tax=Elaeis guineensis var. tenera TaxID=51953 RepID=A0A6I9RKY8_ELAGV|nr:probable LRR receptor-like serine/threonine-protein kinase At4g37250 [Elaeis guineensis]